MMRLACLVWVSLIIGCFSAEDYTPYSWQCQPQSGLCDVDSFGVARTCINGQCVVPDLSGFSQFLTEANVGGLIGFHERPTARLSVAGNVLIKPNSGAINDREWPHFGLASGALVVGNTDLASSDLDHPIRVESGCAGEIEFRSDDFLWIRESIHANQGGIVRLIAPVIMIDDGVQITAGRDGCRCMSARVQGNQNGSVTWAGSPIVHGDTTFAISLSNCSDDPRCSAPIENACNR